MGGRHKRIQSSDVVSVIYFMASVWRMYHLILGRKEARTSFRKLLQVVPWLKREAVNMERVAGAGNGF